MAEVDRRVLFWGHVWVTPEDAARLERDATMYGNAFVKLTKQDGSRVEAKRIDPLAIYPTERGGPR